MPVVEASKWASQYMKRKVTISNIAYLIQYAKINKYEDGDGKTFVDIDELKNYYDTYVLNVEKQWKKKLGEDIDWNLAFDVLPEKERTKHVHGLHPYKGKFIPQLVEYFLDRHTDDFKKESYFAEGDIVIDPFMGSGTTLVVALEYGINSIGIDISEFNCILANVKTGDYDIFTLNFKLEKALSSLEAFSRNTFSEDLDIEIQEKLSQFNKQYFPAIEYKKKVRNGEIDANKYSKDKFEEFLRINKDLKEKKRVLDFGEPREIDTTKDFISTWYNRRIRKELSFYVELIKREDDPAVANVMKAILSRTARSCRATTHSDLATLVKPQYGPYYCEKHFKICTPVNSIIKHIRTNTYDTIERLDQYSRLKKNNVVASVIHGDSRNIDVTEALQKINSNASKLLSRKIDGVFTSPPYVGQINYHEQHAYSYEMFNIPREDENEIGSMSKGKGKAAQQEYIEGISMVLRNISRFVKDNGNYFIVANDKFALYPEIAKRSGFEIIQEYKRPVLNRTERDRQPYWESIFHIRKISA